MAKEKQQKKRRFGGKGLTAAIVVLCVAGVSIIAYPFVLTGVIERSKDEVVRQLEAELPIYRDPKDFEPVDVAAMEVVEPPTWSAEEIAQAGQPMGLWETMVGSDTRAAFAQVLGGGQSTEAPSSLPVGALPTLIPQVLQSDDTLVTLQPRETETTAAGTGGAAGTGEAATGQPAGTRSPQATPAPAPTNAPPMVAEAVSGSQVAPATSTASPQPAAVAAAALTDAPESTLGPAATDLPGAVVASEPRNLEAERQQALEEILRDQAPVYYEDFSDTMARAETLYASMEELAASFAGSREKEIPGEVRMTFQGIQSQLLSMQSLFTTSESLPGASGTYATLQKRDGGEEKVLISDGIGELYDTLKQLGRAHVMVQTVAVYPEASDQVQLGLDEVVLIGDQLQNVLDHLAKYLPDADSDLYVRYRASSQVGETEALYLLEIPSIGLKVGCFQDLTFEQMYKSMRKGAAMFPRMGTPNTNTNITMSAHRTGSAAFFKSFDQIKNGDEILLHTRTLGSFRYLVEGVAIIENDDWTTTYSVGYPALTLLSCEEFEGVTNGRRIVVRGRLIGRAQM